MISYHFITYPTLFLRIPCIISIFLVCIACEYIPDETKLTHIDKPVTPAFEFNIDSGQDTILITGNPAINFIFHCKGHEVYQVTGEIDGEVVSFRSYNQIGDTLSDDLVFWHYFEEDGDHHLKVKIKVSSETGSLADLWEKEGVELSRDYTIRYRKYQQPAEITFLGERDGRLVVCWDTSETATFVSYELTKETLKEDDSLKDRIMVLEIGDRSVGSYIDTAYVGGRVSYSIKVYDGYARSEEGSMVYDEYSMNLMLHTTSELTRVVAWSRNPFYRNFGHLDLMVIDGGGHTLKETYRIDDFRDTSIILNDQFGEALEYRSAMYPEGGEEETSYTGVKQYTSCDSFNSCQQLRITYTEPYSIYGSSGEEMFVYSPESELTTSATMHTSNLLGCSMSGEYMVISDYLVYPKTLHYSTLGLRDQLVIGSYLEDLSISDNGILVGLAYNKFHVYDIKEKHLDQVIEIKYYGTHVQGEISPNGEFIILRSTRENILRVWEYDQETMQFKPAFNITSSDGDILDFCLKYDLQESRIAFSRQGVIEQWSLDNEQQISSAKMTVSGVSQYDPVTGNLICFHGDTLLIVNPDDYSLQWKIAMDEGRVPFRPDTRVASAVVVNSVVYSDGIKLDMKNYEILP